MYQNLERMIESLISVISVSNPRVFDMDHKCIKTRENHTVFDMDHKCIKTRENHTVFDTLLILIKDSIIL